MLFSASESWNLSTHPRARQVAWASVLFPAGEEALTMYMDKSRLDRKSGNATQSVEALHQLASSYFVDRDGTMRRLHEIQISTGAIKVRMASDGRFLRQQHCNTGRPKGRRNPWLHPMELTAHPAIHSDQGCQVPCSALNRVIKVTTGTDFLGQHWLWSWHSSK